MADEPPLEGWSVQSGTAARVAIAVPLLVLVMLSVAVWFYYAKLRPERMRPVTPFPAPGLESYVHPGVEDPEPAAVRPRRDPAIARAQAEVAREGLPGWPAATR